MNFSLANGFNDLANPLIPLSFQCLSLSVSLFWFDNFFKSCKISQQLQLPLNELPTSCTNPAQKKLTAALETTSNLHYQLETRLEDGKTETATKTGMIGEGGKEKTWSAHAVKLLLNCC